MRRFMVISILLAFCLPTAPRAQLSPGPLQALHAPWEGLRHCTRCHGLGKGVLAERCLDCHELLAERIEAGKGLHARDDHADCVSCHSDHQGEDYLMIRWPGKGDESSFDHDLTGYPLEGAHAKRMCRDCHRAALLLDAARIESASKRADRSFLGLGTSCLDCHEDPHREQLGADCRRCHDMEAWRPADGFDHESTAYPLRGRHVGVACESCHPRAGGDPDELILRFANVPFADCADCHRDPHAGRFPEACASCHDVESWRAVAGDRFDHDRSRYPLRGRHASLTCERCHRAGEPLSPLAHASCVDCHDDVHRGQIQTGSEACERCHAVAGFAPSSFTIARHAEAPSRYPLEGAHRAVPCRACHEPTRRAPAGRFRHDDTACAACHADPHALPAEGAPDCETCHRVENWRHVVYDHAVTRFPLEEAHGRVACRGCHANGGGGETAPRFGGAPSECARCHEDIHAGQFNTADGAAARCDACHDTRDWYAARFDHDRDSRFPLDGAHSPLACAACHPPMTPPAGSLRFRPLGIECRDCHAETLTSTGEVKP